MSDPAQHAELAKTVTPYLWLIPGVPLLAAAVTAFLGPVLKKHAHWPCVLAIPTAFVFSVLAFLAVYGAGHHGDAGVVRYYDWIKAGDVDISLSLRADALSTLMLVMITFIASFIAIYAVGYMDGDPGYPRFFAAVALFVFSMTLLVLGDNFIVLFAGWEGVGLCSYLLIGFWYAKPSAADAARKAFLVTRIGDVGLMLGVLLIWLTYGSIDYATVFTAVEKDFTQGQHAIVLYAIALLLFCGAAGKSAQFPLHVWLPDAMEGPTPVSALIHAATMVTAGVYLIARCTPIYMAAPEAQLIVACLGGFTALLAALIALTQEDLKRVLAYSTLSQLGYMFLALGSAVVIGSDEKLVTFAVTAAMFHLFTHAFFKALLFLGAGSVMHAMGHVIDMRRFSGLRQVMPITHATFLCGALALAGIPLFSGFWSKDEILAATYEASHSHRYGSTYTFLLAIGLVTAGLTAFYTFRAYFKTFWGELHIPEEADAHHGHDHGHDAHKTHDAPTSLVSHGHGAHDVGHGKRNSYESPASMTIPLLVLAPFALFVGLVLGIPPLHLFANYVGLTPYLPEHGEHHPNLALMGISSAIALAGVGVAWLFYVKVPSIPVNLAKSYPFLYQLSLNKFFIDEIYLALFVRPLEALAHLFRRVDSDGVDGVVDVVGHSPRLLGELFRPLQNGLVQFYALATVLGLAVFLLSMLLKM